MVAIIVEYIYRIVLFIIGMSAYAFVAGTVLPKFFLTLKYDGKPDGRALRKFTFPGGRAISYEPHPALRRFLPMYALIAKDDKKYLKLKTAPSVYRIEYDVVAFNNRNRVLDILNVKESIDSGAESRSVILPDDTSYVSLLIYKVNEKSYVDEAPYKLERVKEILYIISVFVLTFAVTFLFVGQWNAVSVLLADLINIDYDLTVGFLAVALISLAVSAILARVTLKAYRRRGTR